MPLCTRRGSRFSVLDKLNTLDKNGFGDWDVWFKDSDDNSFIKGRLCAIRKSEHAIKLAQKKILSKASSRGRKIKAETLEYAKYIIIFTTVSRHNLKVEEVLMIYRNRWQVELVFKRLKSIIGIGHLPKINEESCIAWLHGKMLVALLVERLHLEAIFFSPWGYPIF